MKLSAGTTFQQAQRNSSVANIIMENQEIQQLIGIYNVDGHGVVHLTTQLGKAFIGQKLCHQRKPSHYKVNVIV